MLVEGLVAFVLADPRIAESSGLVAASTPGIVFTHNDSGDEARFFAVDEQGRTVTTYLLPDVQARDWEDVARGPDEDGRSSLWLGDIGDNDAQRERGLLVHRVAEPVPDGRDEVVTEAPTSFRLRYEDGPGDAETLLVHPRTGRLWIVGKPFAGAAGVYAAPEVLDAGGPNALVKEGEVETRSTGTPGGPGIGTIANRLVTAGDIAADGSRVALRTYTDLYEWPLAGDDVAAALEGEPVVTPLPVQEQGEGLAYAPDGRSLLLSSEGVGSTVYRVAAADLRPAAEPGREDGSDRRWPLLAAGGVLALLVLLREAVRRRRFARR